MANITKANAKTNTGTGTGTQLGIKPWVLVVPVLLTGLAFLPSSAVIGAGMIPTLVARLVDTSQGRRLSITVGAMNLVGCLYFLHRIWSAGHRVSDIPVVLGDTFGWFYALMGAGMGWAIFGAMPTLIEKIAQAQTSVRLHHITGDQDRLVKEWGESVRGVSGVKAVKKEEGEA